MAISEDDIERYRKGLLNSKERNALEKKAMNDLFLEDALEGSHLVSANEFSSDLNELANKIETDSSKNWVSPMRIAAGVLILIGVGFMFFWIDFSKPVTLVLKESALPTGTDSIKTNKISDTSGSLMSLNKAEKSKHKEETESSPTPLQEKLKATSKKNTLKALPIAKGMGIASVTENQPSPLAESEVIVTRADDIKIDQPVMSSPVVANHLRDESSMNKRSKELSKKFTGQVVAEDGLPIPGVNVIVKDTEIGTVTDADGNFQIATNTMKPKLVFSFIGMSTVETKPVGGTSDLKIEMKEYASQLSEVVVTGFSDRERESGEPVIKSALPVGGIPAYNTYLENKLRYPIEALENNIKGNVKIEFTISTSGVLSDFNILKGLGHGCDDEVIRLVKDGPKWNPTTVDNVSIETQVRVKVKFDPAKAKK